MATNGKVINIIFDDPMLLAKVVLDNDTSKIIILEKLMVSKQMQIELNSDVAKTAQQTEEQQINKCFKLLKKSSEEFSYLYSNIAF
ncbi:hypothetical protein F8M41_022886 [Gigaspora margarita]|uniref:Uncharacterized protein n=1 Tax=Gigaspora margarita TaxID=4874 RepID=A0A8H4AEB8_GIGMA|nr:hypothetical protein F8M41_022886 [Gigaspora margarita]